jgi:DNA-binding transcriptional LysR family regulator
MDLMVHELIGSDTDTAILDGFKALGFEASKDWFAFRTGDFIVQWQAVRVGLDIGFVASCMARTDHDVVPVLPDLLRVPPLPMWLAVHRDIRSSQFIRSVYDYLAEALSDAK